MLGYSGPGTRLDTPLISVYNSEACTQLAVEEELGQADLDSLLQLIPSDLSSLPSWLSETIFPFFLAHCPHQMVCSHLLLWVHLLVTHTHTHTHIHTHLQTLFLSQLTTVLCCLEQNDPVSLFYSSVQRFIFNWCTGQLAKECTVCDRATAPLRFSATSQSWLSP